MPAVAISVLQPENQKPEKKQHDMKHAEFPKGFLNSKDFSLTHPSTLIQAVTGKGRYWM